jgi:hypothetical protein
MHYDSSGKMNVGDFRINESKLAKERIQINFAKRIIKTMPGGKIWANSSFLHGTSYFIRFPVSKQQVEGSNIDYTNALHVPDKS